SITTRHWTTRDSPSWRGSISGYEAELVGAVAGAGHGEPAPRFQPAAGTAGGRATQRRADPARGERRARTRCPLAGAGGRHAPPRRAAGVSRRLGGSGRRRPAGDRVAGGGRGGRAGRVDRRGAGAVAGAVDSGEPVRGDAGAGVVAGAASGRADAVGLRGP